jgi:flagellar protein FlbT
MPLKLSLKPHEKLLINGAVVENGASRTEFTIHNRVSVLRQKDIMKEEAANTPAKRIGFVVQLLYISSDNRTQLLGMFHQLVAEMVVASASSIELLLEISRRVAAGDFYSALQTCRKLIEHEKRILDHATGQPSGL